MSELPPEIAIEPEPTDADPAPETIRPDRPRIWPEEPRAPRPQIKRPMEEWLAEFEERVKQSDPRSREQPGRRRRPRGLARIVPAAPPVRRAKEMPSRIQTGAAAGEAAVEAGARVRVVRPLKAVPPLVHRRAELLTASEFAGIEWSIEALA